VVDLKFDALGIIIFLWFIFRGIQNSKVAKRKSEDRRRNEPRSINTVRPLVKEQESREVRQEPRPEPKAEPMSMPSWFPFPMEMQGREVPQKEKKEPSPKVKSINKDKKIELVEKTKPELKGKVASSVIEIQEEGWRSGGQGVTLDKKSVVNGMIWSEILGPPRAKKKIISR